MTALRDTVSLILESTTPILRDVRERLSAVNKKHVIIGLSTAFFLRITIKQYKKKKQFDNITTTGPGARAGYINHGFFFGNLFEIIKNYNDMMMFFADELAAYGNTTAQHTAFFAPGATVVSQDEEVARMVLQEKSDYFHKGARFNDILEEILLQGLIGRESGRFAKDKGLEWKRGRRLALEVLNITKFKYLLEITADEMTANLISVLQKKEQNGEGIDLAYLFQSYAFDFFGKFAWDADFKSMENGGHPFQKANLEVTQRIKIRLMNPFWKLFRFFQCSEAERDIKRNGDFMKLFSLQLVRDARQKFEGLDTEESNSLRGKSILAEAIHLTEKWKKEESHIWKKNPDIFLRDFVLNLNFAALGTTSLSFTWIFYVLSTHPQFLTKLRQELKQHNYHNNYDFSYDALCRSDKYPFLHGLIWEIMRKYPPVAQDPRAVASDITLPTGHHLKKDDTIVIFIYGFCMNPDYWENPKELRPERWINLKQEKNLPPQFKKHPTAATLLEPDPHYLPIFIYGSRECVGKSMAMYQLKYVVSRIVTHFDFIVPPEKTDAYSNVFLHELKGGLPVHVKSIA